MSDPQASGFLRFLESGLERGGFETDDVLAVILPLMRKVLSAHEAGLVAPLEGVEDLIVTDAGHLRFVPAKVKSPEKHTARVEALQQPASEGVVVVGESSRTADLDAGTVTVASLGVGREEEGIRKPVFLPGYRCWEHAVGHHDELTDLFSLGTLLASLACGLDFNDPEELERFVACRDNLFALNRRLNPVLAAVIVELTELDRHKRAQDLPQVMSRLERYRDQPAQVDVERIEGFLEAGVEGRRRLIQSHLRDRLFEISRRNRLIYFKPTLHTLNLTIASVPLMLDVRHIRLDQLFVWHSDLADTLTRGAAISLGKYLRFEDAPYIPGVLDKIISEARRDRNEYGFAQLRLVNCFLRWNNLKEDRTERIHSPLLLLPVELTRKKGVRDAYILEPTSSEAEVNPALRHHLKELYNLDLPESIELKDTSLDTFHAELQARIQASEPAVTLHKIDRPRIELIHERARQRLDQYRRRLRRQARRSRQTAKPSYSYNRDEYRPLGLQIFLEHVRPAPMPLREATGAPPLPRLPHIVDPTPTAPGKTLEAERQTYALREGDNQNPYAWDFDLCNLTLGNFNYRKMTLVRDYANLIEADIGSGAFDRVFSLAPRPVEEPPPPPLDLADQHLVVPCDATQASAIARARTGASYIIQGPPGTGKSQTITNLIADYVARGKRVLFVCEKRAAIDVVFHRLRQQGLDELCCLIHDSQTDKKAFIQNLKQTYEAFLDPGGLDADAEAKRTKVLRGMNRDLEHIQRFSSVMEASHPRIGLPVRTLLHRLVALCGRAREWPPEVRDLLPDYPLWLEHGEVVERLRATLSEEGQDHCFARHPLRWLGPEVITADRPLETLTRHLDQAEDLIDSIGNALELSGLPGNAWSSFEEIRILLEFAVQALPLAERGLLGVLKDAAAAREFESLSRDLDRKAQTLEKATTKTHGWSDKLLPDDTEAALAQAKAMEGSIFRFLQPAFWRLRKALRARYDFSRHAILPAWSKILSDLSDFHKAQSAHDQARQQAREAWRCEDADAFRETVETLRTDSRVGHASVRALLELAGESQDSARLIASLADIHEPLTQLDGILSSALTGHEALDFPGLSEALVQLREQASLIVELAPILAELAALPEPLGHALRQAPVSLDDFEAAMGDGSLEAVWREDRAAGRMDGRALARRVDQLRERRTQWLDLNARCLRMATRRTFQEHVQSSTLPASQLDADQKAFKKVYASGRRELEHEFGKTMRYKSIRDLAAGNTGRVIQDLKPIWLMSPLSVSDTLPLDPDLFDVVIFDEASQIPLEEAIPAVYRSHQVIVVGDEMQLPPTTFFSSGREEEEEESIVIEEDGERIEVDLDSDSFLTQSARNLPSTLLAWHYRSRYESLISYSNAAFYAGDLFTIPDRQRTIHDRPELIVADPAEGERNVDALLARSVSFHLLEHGLYEDRRNANEAAYIAQLVRELLARGTPHSIGIVAFSEAQQGEIESALNSLAEEDKAFSERLETEMGREENDVFCGLFVKNLENVQGDERDIIIMSVCYGPNAQGRMLMNFGPINQRGGEKRLNVIFSRAKHHMAIVSSIRHHQITNDYNDGANSLKNFLHYAEAWSMGDEPRARRVLESLNPLSRKALSPPTREDAVVTQLAEALRARGHEVDLHVGQSRFRCDLAIRRPGDTEHQLGILVDTEGHYANPNLLDRYLLQPTILRVFGWRIAVVLTKDWYQQPETVVKRLEKLLKDEAEESGPVEEDDGDEEDEEVWVEHAQPEVAGRVAVQPPLPNAVTAPEAASSVTRCFKFVGCASRKFWEISVAGHTLTVRFGRMGTQGQSQTKTFDNEARAQREAERLIAAKVKKGYVETG